MTLTFETLAFWLSIVVATFGFVALLMVGFRWSWLGRHYKEFWAKIAVGFFRAVAAISAVAARPLPIDSSKPFLEQPWATTIGIAALGYFVWEIAGAWGDHKFKRSKEKTADDFELLITELKQSHKNEMDAAAYEIELGKQEILDITRQLHMRSILLQHLRDPDNERKQRIRKFIAGNTELRASIQHVRSVINPKQQVEILLEHLASLFRTQAILIDGSKHAQNFRVGLFCEVEGRLAPIAGFELATKSHLPFTAYSLHADRFRLDNYTNPSHAVRCIHEGKTLIVPDCAAFPDFYFHDKQSSYLKSMVAMPLAGFSTDGNTSVRAALLVDTNVSAFFIEEERPLLESQLMEFVNKLELEYTLLGLTS